MDRRELLALLGEAGLAGFACRPDKEPGDPSLQLAQGGPPYQFKALDAHQAATVAVLVDCIIPATETPGASVCATIATFSSTVRIRRGALPTAIDVPI